MASGPQQRYVQKIYSHRHAHHQFEVEPVSIFTDGFNFFWPKRGNLIYLNDMNNFIALLFFITAVFSGRTHAEEPKSQGFIADVKVQKIAEAYALDAVDLAKSQFGITLDWSDASIEDVERALVKIHASYVATTPRPTPEEVMSFAKGLGSYIGEVYRRNHGGEWGMVSLGGQKFPGLRTKAGTNFWPWGRVSNRITDGAENNVFDYYQMLLKK